MLIGYVRVSKSDGTQTLAPERGRLKEIINRGAEKINPIEIDEVLMDHPAVQQVVTFALSHRMLGEEVAAAVVVREEKFNVLAWRRSWGFPRPEQTSCGASTGCPRQGRGG